MTINKFPECTYLGEFYSSQYGNLPAYIPATLGGFCLHYLPEQAERVNRLVENVALCLLEDTPAKFLKVHIMDFATRPNFPFLNQLRNEGLCEISLNEQASIQTFNDLEGLSQYRYHHLFASGETTLDQYNARSPRPESYHLLIINTTYFPQNGLSALRLQDFIKNAYGAGIYIIALHDKTQADEHNKAQNALLQSLTAIEFSDNFSTLHIDENLLPVQKMAQVGGFEFMPADVNQTQIINHIKEQFVQKTDDTEQDFLSISIGKSPKGEPIYLNLGERSKNYHAMILGKTGTGKSTLMNNIIMQIGEHYHAGQICLYLMDYKQGVEFNKFKQHPNVAKIFLDSQDIQAGIRLLEEVKQEIAERYELLKSHHATKISEYNRNNPNYPLAYHLIMIDEFHKILKGDFRHNEYVNRLLEDIAKLGRAVGYHLFLSTQSLKDVNLDSSIIDQIDLRMTYRVLNDSALGFNIFDDKHRHTILNLDNYQVFIQKDGHAAQTAFVDKPLEIDSTIQRLRHSRPPHLQVQAQILQSVTKQATDSTQTTSATPQSGKINQKVQDTTFAEISNPNAKRFDSLEAMKVWQKQLNTHRGKDSKNNDDDILTPDWLNN